MPIACNVIKDVAAVQKQLEEIRSRCQKNKILWVGGEQANTYYERMVSESCGITIKRATDISEAFAILGTDSNYFAVVYDIDGNNGDDARKEFLDKIKKMKIKIPIFTHNKY